MGLRDIIRAIREYPAARAELDTARSELRQVQQALEQSAQKQGDLWHTLEEQKDYTKFLASKAEALKAVLVEFCPRLSTPEELKRFYDTISPDMDERGFTLYHMAKELTGIDVPSCFPYEDNRGLFEEMEGHQLLDWLTAVRFQAVDWDIIPGNTYECATLREVDTSVPEYQAFEQQLYAKALSRMGFENLLGPEQEAGAIENKVTELKLYSPLSGELTDPEDDQPQAMDGGDLTPFQDVILREIGDEQLTEEADRGLMLYYDGPSAVDEKVISFFPSVEKVDGRLYGVAVCRITAPLSPEEIAELKEYCCSQYNDAWGEGFAQRPRHTEYGDLYVSFYIDNSTYILTKEELETAGAPSHAPHQPKRGGGAR